VTSDPQGLLELAESVDADALLQAAARIDGTRSQDAEVAVVTHHGLAKPGLMTTPWMWQAGALAYREGLLAFDRLERSFLPPAAAWIHHDLRPEHFAVRLLPDRLEAPKMWPFCHDLPVADYQLTSAPKWWSHGLVHALLGGARWPGMSEWELMHTARLSEALAAWHWYWLAELGRAYCPAHSVVSGDATPECVACQRLEADGGRAEVRAERLRGEDARQVAVNALEVLRYEADAYREGLRSGLLRIPRGRYLDQGEACEYARYHQARLASRAWTRWAESCLTPGVDFAASPEAYEARAAWVVRALLEPLRELPSPDQVAPLRARRVLQDLGWRICHAAALLEDEARGLEAALRVVAGALRELPQRPPADADAVVGRAIAGLAELLAAEGVGSASTLLALGYRPTQAAAAEPQASRAAREAAYLRRLRASGSPLAPFLERLPEVVSRVLAGPRYPHLAGEVMAVVDGLDLKDMDLAFKAGLLSWLGVCADRWGPDHAALHGDSLWYYRLSCRSLPPEPLWDAYRARPNPTLDGVPCPFDLEWLGKALARALPTDRPFKPRPTTSVAYVVVGQGRERPLLLPLTQRRKRLLDALQETPTVRELVARGFAPEALEEALREGLIVVLGQAREVRLYNVHPARPFEAGPVAAVLKGRAVAASPDAIQAAELDLRGPWNEPAQAQWYEAYCARSTTYQDLSRALVAYAEIPPEGRVCDLGSGTGVTTRAVLEVLGPEGQVWGVDPAPRMVTAATRSVIDPRVRFYPGTGRDLPRMALLLSGFTSVVSSSAIWLDPEVEAALAGIRGGLAAGGRAALSIPAEYLGHAEHLVLGYAVEVAEALTRARASLEVEVGAVDLKPHPLLGSPEKCRDALARAGLGEVEFELWARPWRVADYLDWIGQPVVLSGMCPGLNVEGQERFLGRVRAELDPEARLEARWFLVRARVR
jgi:SAM-dependent methyltransferase